MKLWTFCTNVSLQLARKVESRPELGYVISGFVDVDWKGCDEFQNTGHSLVADFNGFVDGRRRLTLLVAMLAKP